jgi:hypothetical protein
MPSRYLARIVAPKNGTFVQNCTPPAELSAIEVVGGSSLLEMGRLLRANAEVMSASH